MRGHLGIKDLEAYKKADLQKLARELGVSDEGTIKEMAARCAEVEVEIPDDDAEGQQGSQNAPEGQQMQLDEVEVEATQTYKDLELKRIVEKGERLVVKKNRAAVLEEKKVAKTVEV